MQSWSQNAENWTRAVRERRIPSRVKATDRAILEAVGAPPVHGVSALLDLGCGEGWLARLLSDQGWQVLGVDGSPELVQSAGGSPGFLCCSYEQLEMALSGRHFHTVVANFSLLGEESTELAVAAAFELLQPGGRLLVQTLHPIALVPYFDGWRTEDWAGFGEPSVGASEVGSAWAPAPWYFRTLESWCRVLARYGFSLRGLNEPRESRESPPLSLLLLAQK